MPQKKIQDSLAAKFTNQRFVFWHDDGGEFASEIATLDLPAVTLVQVDQTPALQLKLDVERAGADVKWLFYSEQPEPDTEHDWLLDLRMRGATFSADSTSILLADLGLALSLRGHLQAHAKFLRARDRLERLQRLVTPDDTAADLDRKMIAILVRAEQPDCFSILLKLFTGLEQAGDANLDGEPKGWADLESYDLLPSFWRMVADELGYADPQPTLRDLLFCLFVSDLARGIRGGLPAQLKHFQLPDSVKAASASVFLSQWRANITHFASYNAISKAVASELQLANLISSLHAEDLLDAMTFAEVEQWIIKDLRDRIISGGGASLDAVRAIFARRRDGHWANPKLAANSDVTRALVASYEALEAAAELFDLQALYAAGFSFASADVALDAYQKQFYRFDQSYRHFHYAASQVEPMGWALLHSLRDRVEEIYSGWFVPQLGLAWAKVIEGGSGLLHTWQVPGWLNQQQFYKREVKPLLDGGLKRVFVVISDAFRFEAAEELGRDINSRNRFKASLSSMLGVLPSYTTLGMAALLPHQSLAYKENTNLDVMVDGQPVTTTEQRSALLASYDGIAIKWEELLELGKDKGRERVKDARVVYVYHDRIDMLGDKAASETKTFEAVAATLKELYDLLGFIINNLNASTVLVTADHGFLYQESALDVADKSTIEVKPDGVLKSKKRYILGKQLGASDKAWYGSTAVTAGTAADASLDFWVPKAATRFHFAGGARFVHGSAMPQEIVVPLLTVKVSESEKAKTRQVEIAPLMLSAKVVTNMQRFEFIQTEPVSARVLQRTVHVSLRDGDAPISNEAIVTFDSQSASMDERKKSVMLTILAGSYDRNKDYHLVVRDAQSKVELLRTPLKIDLALANDF